MTTDPRDMVACMCGHLVWHHTSSADSSVPFAGKCITPGCRCEMYRPWLKVVEEVGGGCVWPTTHPQRHQDGHTGTVAAMREMT